ncbi:MAG: xanthine dehydrogenase family protein molybdopterin-binding subunit [Planctomycetota bacterium]
MSRQEPAPGSPRRHAHQLPNQEHGLIGRRIPLIDARRKATGQAIYTDDIRLPGMLVGKILRSPHPHARIISIDTGGAERIEGVRAVLTGREAPNRFGVLPVSQDETALAVDKVRFVGDGVAAVAADDEETALRALDAIQVEYELLRPFLNMEESLEEVAEVLRIHEKTVGQTNIHKQVEQDFGDVDAARANAQWFKEQKFRFIGVTHAYTEPLATIAHYDADGRMTVWSAQQVPHYLHRALARVLEMDMHRIRVVRPTVGGGFGGKSDPFPHEMVAALLSRKAKRPVRILFDREEVFYNNHGRHPSRIRVGLAIDDEHRISALDIDALIDGGAWGSFGVVTTYYNGVLANGPYRVKNFRYRGRRVYSNKPPCGAMRGHGAVNTRFALEVLMDEAACDLGLDPARFRIDNALPAYTRTINEFRITTNGVVECIERAAQASGWAEKHKKLPFGRGVGIACGFYISGSALPIHWDGIPQSTVHLKIDLDGGVTIHSMAAEIGQGSDTMLAQIVADVLGLPIHFCRVRSEDSDTAPIDLGSYSSRVTFMAGNAARRAAEEMRALVIDGASALTGHAPELFILKDAECIHVSMPEVSVPYLEALRAAMKDRGSLQTTGCYSHAPPMGGKYKGAAAGLSPTYSFQAYIVEVEVDLRTGKPGVKEVWAAHDCGKALNPLAVEAQIEGCVHMGIGQVLSEDFVFHKGHVLNPNLLDYRTLSPTETPEIHPILVETDDPEGPYGAKECGEGPLLPALPAVANAIHDAVGLRFYELPITADRIWRALNKGRRRARKGDGIASR